MCKIEEGDRSSSYDQLLVVMILNDAFTILADQISIRNQERDRDQFNSHLAAVEIKNRHDFLDFLQDHISRLSELAKFQIPIVTLSDEATKSINDSKGLISALKEKLDGTAGNIKKLDTENALLGERLHTDSAEHQHLVSELDLECKARAKRIYSLMQQRDRLKMQLDLLVERNSEVIKAETEKKKEELASIQKLEKTTRMQRSVFERKIQQLEEESEKLKEKKRKLLASIAVPCD